MFLLLCIVHGLQFLTIRTTGKLRTCTYCRVENCTTRNYSTSYFCRCRVMENRYFHWSWYRVDYGSNRSFCSVMCVNIIKQRRRDGWAFFMTSLTIILLSASVFAGMFPRVLISSLGSIYDLTIYNAASGRLH